MFIHSSTFHIAFNILVQLILGIPLEMVHGEKKTDKKIIVSVAIILLLSWHGHVIMSDTTTN